MPVVIGRSISLLVKSVTGRSISNLFATCRARSVQRFVCTLSQFFAIPRKRVYEKQSLAASKTKPENQIHASEYFQFSLAECCAGSDCTIVITSGATCARGISCETTGTLSGGAAGLTSLKRLLRVFMFGYSILWAD